MCALCPIQGDRCGAWCNLRAARLALAVDSARGGVLLNRPGPMRTGGLTPRRSRPPAQGGRMPNDTAPRTHAGAPTLTRPPRRPPPRPADDLIDVSVCI